MLEIRTYEGDGGAVARLMRDVWTPDYRQSIPIALWDERLIEWQLLAEGGAGRDFLVAAYDGTRLAGVLFAEPSLFSLRGEEVRGTVGRFLTVHPDYRSKLVAFQLLQELRRRHLARSHRFCIGYSLGGLATPSGVFWAGMQRAMPGLTTNLGRIGYEVRLLDHSAVARWSQTWYERWGTRLLGLVQGVPTLRSGSDAVRRYVPDDLPACLRLARKALQRVELGYAWTSAQLGNQLQYKDVVRTWVAEEKGRVSGFINYYPLDCLANGVLRIGVIDLLAVDELKGRTARALLRTTLARMKAEGIQMALLLRLFSRPWKLLAAAGFAPLPTNHSLVCLRMDPSLELAGVRRYYIQYR
jgi:GNAT superfamily N-acetyltransferase